MGNAAIKAESAFGDKISRSCGSSEIRPTLGASKSSADTLTSFEDAVSITTDSTPSTTEYESANESGAKRFSSGSDISCDFPVDTKSSTSLSDCSSLSNDWATTTSESADQRTLVQLQPSTAPSNPFADQRFALSPNSVVRQQRASIEELDRENQQFLRSPDRRTRSKVKRHEESCRRASKRPGKYSQPTAEEARKKRQPRRPAQKPPVVHSDFFIFSYDHVFKEADEVGSQPNQLQKIGQALSDTISKVSQLLDDAEGGGWSSKLPHFAWTRLLNVRAAHAPFFEFNVDNVHLFRGCGSPPSKLDAVEVRQFFAEQAYLDLVEEFEFCVKSYARRLTYVVDVTKSVAVVDCRLAAVEDEPCSPRTMEDSSNRLTIGTSRQVDSEYGPPEEVQECFSSTKTKDTTDSMASNPVSNTNVESVPYVNVANEAIVIPPGSDAIPSTSACEVGSAAPTDTANDLLAFVYQEPAPVSEYNSNATSLELVDDKRSSLGAEETEEFDSCAESVDGGPASEGWSDICSIQSENSFAFPSLRSEIMQCAFQLDSIDSENMNCNENVSEAGPATAADLESISNIPFLNDSSELDYISKIGGTGLVAENLRKQSLYVKFDPLVAGEADVPFNGDATLKLEDTLDSSKHDLANDTLLQPRSEEKRRTSDFNESLTCENGTVGKLISVTPNRSPRKITPRSSPRFPETDPDDVAKLQSLLLKQMKKEEAFKEEIDSLKRDYELVLQKLQNSEKEISRLKAELESTQENEKKLKNDLKERIKSKQQLSVVMGEYEKTISQMLTKRDEEKKEFEATVKKVEAERDSTVQHLNNLENAFNDIHQKYERGKIVNEALKKNEELLQKSISEYETTVKTVENKYELLKSHATSQLEKANQELELITQSYEKEQAKLKAMLRKSEITINSLQNAFERKTKENQELTAICDELIVKLSTHSNA